MAPQTARRTTPSSRPVAALSALTASSVACGSHGAAMLPAPGCTPSVSGSTSTCRAPTPSNGRSSRYIYHPPLSFSSLHPLTFPIAGRLQQASLRLRRRLQRGTQEWHPRPRPPRLLRRRLLGDAQAHRRRARPRAPPRPALRVLRRPALPRRRADAVRDVDGVEHVPRLRPRYGLELLGYKD